MTTGTRLENAFVLMRMLGLRPMIYAGWQQALKRIRELTWQYEQK